MEPNLRTVPYLILGCLLLASVAGAHSPDVEIPTQEDLPLAERLMETWGNEPLQQPTDERSLLQLITAFDEQLGVQRDPTDLQALQLIPPPLVESVRDLLATLDFVQSVRDEEFAGIDDAQLLDHLHTEHADPEALTLIAQVDEDRMRAAAVTLAAAVDRHLPLLQSMAVHDAPGLPGMPLSPPLIDLAPVFVMDPLGMANLYEKDAVLMIDLGGDDVYDANVGGAMIHRNVVGDPDSCQDHLLGYDIGCENEDSFESFTASLHIDVAGDDTYGVYKPPRPGSRDANCGPEPIIRRVVTYGSGSGGIGMHVDTGGNDQYHGKTLSMGNGHLAGVGVFFNLQGDDTYETVRSAMGSSILQGSGFFFDGIGDDTYTFRAPAGGLWNVDRFRCDASERLGLGSAVVQGHATFIDLSGQDTYRVGSQAFGHTEFTGLAQFFDLGGEDDYGGYPDRGNNQLEIGEATFVDQD